jgi:hypothetical protein
MNRMVRYAQCVTIRDRQIVVRRSNLVDGMLTALLACLPPPPPASFACLPRQFPPSRPNPSTYGA